MADFTTLTYTELRALLLRALQTELPEHRTGESTLAYSEISAYTQGLSYISEYISAIARNLTPLTADEAGLTQWGTTLSLPRKGPTAAYRSLCLQIRGTPGSNIPISTVLSFGNQTYQTTSAAVIGVDGLAVTGIISTTLGSEAKRVTGETLIFTTPPAGIETTAVLILDVNQGGLDEESLGAYRERLLLRWRQGAQGGNRTDYQQQVLLYDFADSAYIYPAYPGIGTVTVAATRDGSGDARLLSVSELSQIETALTEWAPVNDTVVMADLITRRVDVDVRVEFQPEYPFDWDDTDGFTVLAWNASTQELQFNTNIPGDLDVGDLLIVKSQDPSVSLSDGVPVRVAAITAVDTVGVTPAVSTRSVAFNFTPQVGDSIYASSELALDIRNRIESGYSFVDSEGAQQFKPGIDQLGPANPSQQYGNWTSDLKLNNLIAAAVTLPETIDIEIVSPVTDEVSILYPYPDTEKIELLISGEIIVRAL